MELLMNAKWPDEYLARLRKRAHEVGNVHVRLVRDMGALDLTDDEFNLIETLVLKPLLSSAELCRVYGLQENTAAYKCIAPYLVRKGNSLSLNGIHALSEETRQFWKTSERFSGKLLCCCNAGDLDLASILKISWDPGAITNPGAAFPQSLIRSAKQFTHKPDRLCFSFFGADRVKEMIAFGEGGTLDKYFDAVIDNCSFLRRVS